MFGGVVGYRWLAAVMRVAVLIVRVLRMCFQPLIRPEKVLSVPFLGGGDEVEDFHGRL